MAVLLKSQKKEYWDRITKFLILYRSELNTLSDNYFTNILCGSNSNHKIKNTLFGKIKQKNITFVIP